LPVVDLRSTRRRPTTTATSATAWHRELCPARAGREQPTSTGRGRYGYAARVGTSSGSRGWRRRIAATAAGAERGWSGAGARSWRGRTKDSHHAWWINHSPIPRRYEGGLAARRRPSNNHPPHSRRCIQSADRCTLASAARPPTLASAADCSTWWGTQVGNEVWLNTRMGDRESLNDLFAGRMIPFPVGNRETTTRGAMQWQREGRGARSALTRMNAYPFLRSSRSNPL
jgi:hypothetical protein